jgi:hypothetical protein
MQKIIPVYVDVIYYQKNYFVVQQNKTQNTPISFFDVLN